ncbi:hypothetical protein [Streptosporangium canum]|uniref:hypothetical protein n=1 Tax=Streptosporangium canum TaxID=324952 RepID=UPI003414E463
MDRRQWLRTFAVFSAPTIGIALVTAGLAVPTVLLFRTDATTLDRWSKIGEALSPIGVFFSGIAFIGIAAPPAPRGLLSRLRDAVGR